MPTLDSLRFEKAVVITRKTALEELIERFNTREQARFYIEHMGASFDEYQAAHDTYTNALNALKTAMPDGVRSQFVERSFLPTFTFGPDDLVVVLGPDGLVVNTAKYLDAQPLLAFNPDARRIDGVLLPFRIEQAPVVLQDVTRGHFIIKEISMAQAQLNDGQILLAVNDLFIGQASHVSARYRLCFGPQSEDQSSSGIIVSTGAGSTGWMRSVVTGASRVMATFEVVSAAPNHHHHDEDGHEDNRQDTNARRKKRRRDSVKMSGEQDATLPPIKNDGRFDWEAEHLLFSVREPFVSKVSGAQLVFGRIEAGDSLEIVSHMPQNGVIFSDGVEDDFLEFNSGAIARIGLAEKKAHLVVHTPRA